MVFTTSYSQTKSTSQPVIAESEEGFNERMEWWRDMKFGMFIHWGAYSVPGGVYQNKDIKGVAEWIMMTSQIQVEEYEQYAKEFNPVNYNATEWVKTAKNAGVKYIVITSKHHDGFALWDSNVSRYDIVDFASYGKDALKELSAACKEAGIKFGLYYSIMDWHHPQAQRFSYLHNDPNKSKDNEANFAEYFNNYLKPQVKELMDNYDPDIMWFDGEWTSSYTQEQGLELYAYLRELKPSLIINNRVDKGRDGMQGMNKGDKIYVGDFGTPEQEILDTKSVLDWESCMTMNDSWGYKLNDDNWKSAEELVHNLIDVTAKGGNYLLNVGPTAEGLIPVPSVERLQAIGKWIAINGEAIYNTEKVKGNYNQGNNLLLSKKKGEGIYFVYAIKKPKKELEIANLMPNSGSNIYLLGVKSPLSWEVKIDKVIIHLPKELRTKWSDESYAWVFKIEGNEIVD